MFNVRALGFLVVFITTPGCLLGTKVACENFEGGGMCLYNEDGDDAIELKVIEDGGGPISIDGWLKYDTQAWLGPYDRMYENKATICIQRTRFDDDILIGGEVYMADIEDGDENLVCVWPM